MANVEVERVGETRMAAVKWFAVWRLAWRLACPLVWLSKENLTLSSTFLYD